MTVSSAPRERFTFKNSKLENEGLYETSEHGIFFLISRTIRKIDIKEGLPRNARLLALDLNFMPNDN